jgi:type IV pilus assembly protein PilM
LSGLLWRLRRSLLEPEPPLAAIEVRASAVSAIRIGRERQQLVLGGAACFELPPDTLRLSSTEPNVRDAEALRRSLGVLADRVGLAAGGPVALVLPDPVARVAFVPVSELKARSGGELLEELRFRLRKSVPFEIRDAVVSWSELPEGAGRPAQLLVCAIAGPVLQSFEGPLRELGFEPGLVELCGMALAAVGPPAPQGDELLVNWDTGYCSLLLLRGGEPVLFRTLLGELAAQPVEVAREVASTVLYYRDRLGGPGLQRAFLRSTPLPPAQTAELLQDALGCVPEPVDPWRALRGAPAGVESMAFAGAAAAVLGRAA